ncbi:MAG TPA: hypothetical protein PLZ15_09215 [Melioribacteraceae bacterium]|nr:hypothetical protein [Melioribacteraceae bacterium]
MIDQKGEKNFNWRGGVSSDGYRYVKKYRQRYPEREPARKVVYRALKSGKLAKPKFCQHPRCNETEIFAHHHNYKLPLLVMWLCRKHHSDLHNAKNNDGFDTVGEQMNFFNGIV